MATRDILESALARPGCAQSERRPAELAPEYAPIDERSATDLLAFARGLAGQLRFYSDASGLAAGDWQSFLPANTDLDDWKERAKSAPHLALLLSFFELYRVPQRELNQIGHRHLDFFYRRILGFAPRPPRPDRAHLLIELKKNSAPLPITPEHRFTAGKDPDGIEILYAPAREVVVGAARVTSLRSIYLDSDARGTVRCAPVADSADGLGAELPAQEPKWPGLGHAALPAAEIGFALSAPVLRMREGTRTIVLDLEVSGQPARPASGSDLAASFHFFLTGAEGWLGPYAAEPAAVTASSLTFRIAVPAADGAVVDYDPAVHGGHYAAEAPILQAVVRAHDTPLGYADLRALHLRRVRIGVEVAGVTALTLENDHGRLDARKAFLPFTAQPVVGSRFYIGSEEVFAKQLSHLELHIDWQGAPASFHRYYSGYASPPASNRDFVVSATIAGHGGEVLNQLALFDENDASRPYDFVVDASRSLPPPRPRWDARFRTLWKSGSSRARRRALAFALLLPRRPAAKLTLEQRPGFLTLALAEDFRHADYRREMLAKTLKYAQSGGTGNPPSLAEPYTPTIRALSLDYAASSTFTDVASSDLPSFVDGAVAFFHVGCFGQSREHAYLRQQAPSASPAVPLLPSIGYRGQLLIGVAGAQPRDTLHLLFQVAEGSADPDVEAEALEWSVLCDNHWKRLGPGDLLLDTTRSLLTSGIVAFALPPEATTENTLLPGGLLWLRAGLRGDPRSTCELLRVAANALEVVRCSQGHAPGRLAEGLAAGSIAKLKTPIASAKRIEQPYATFGGAAAESDEHLNTRAAERLRHRQRCVTAWDYERIVLEAFPAIQHAKCVAHADGENFLRPGHVLLVVVPDLRNHNAVDPLRPRVDRATLQAVRDHVARRAVTGIEIHVRNPRYQPVQLDFKVRFRSGADFNFSRRRLGEDLVRFLTPWAYGAPRRAQLFGGKVHRSTLLDFVENQPSVDFVTDFRMYTFTGGEDDGHDVATAVAADPATILVSATTHQIAAAEGGD